MRRYAQDHLRAEIERISKRLGDAPAKAESNAVADVQGADSTTVIAYKSGALTAECEYSSRELAALAAVFLAPARRRGARR